MEDLNHYPFSKLRVPEGEHVLWIGNNPTFHRDGEYGFVITDRALYYFSPFWSIFTRWKRYALSSIQRVDFQDSGWFPRLDLKLHDGVAKLRTPYDSYSDEMDFDRRILKEASNVLRQLVKGTQNAY